MHRKDIYDVKRELAKAGFTLTSLATTAGFSESLCRVSMREPCLSGERLIIETTGFNPHDIWPDRYASNGVRIIGRNKSSTKSPHHIRKNTPEFLPIGQTRRYKRSGDM
ncbi:MAG: helix-turn-helix domain-containing protein [Cohaesibacteraceae bacterium]|nr:helix-turn-helix domain-containing protein [Cohaesibacteraceae bacterium]